MVKEMVKMLQKHNYSWDCECICGNVLIMHVIIFRRRIKNCGCYGNGNSQNVAKHMDPEIIKKNIRASLMKLGMWIGWNVLFMLDIFFAVSWKL